MQSHIHLHSGRVETHVVTIPLSASIIDALFSELSATDVFEAVDSCLVLRCDSVLVYEEESEKKQNAKKYIAYFDGGCVVDLIIEDFKSLAIKLRSEEGGLADGKRFVKHENYLLHVGRLVCIALSPNQSIRC